MTFHQLTITGAIRAKSEAIGEERARQADKWDRKSYYECPGYPNKMRNWMGAMGEIFIQREFPWMELTQPYVIYDEDVEGSDFFYKGGIEVKCRHFPHFYKNYLQNVRETKKKGHLSKVLIATAINNDPAKATKFYIFGYIPVEEIRDHPIWKPKFRCNECGNEFDALGIRYVGCPDCKEKENLRHINRISAPAYAIPINQFRDIQELWQPDHLSDFMRGPE